MRIDDAALNGLLRRYRRSAGLSVQGLADALGVSRQTVHRWESGAFGAPPLRYVPQIAQVLGLEKIEATALAESATRAALRAGQEAS